MKILLVAVNAKYIHSNLGVYSLKAYAEKYVKNQALQVDIGEYTINQPDGEVLRDIYRRKPDVVGFSCYIWNITQIRGLARDLKKILPGVKIWLGGPEVSFDAKNVLEDEPDVDLIIMGEGEETFASLAQWYVARGSKKDCESPPSVWMAGVAARDPDGQIMVNPMREPINMDDIPFPYEDLTDFKNRIIYYESSRGCPFSCSYCLSSLEKTVRFRNLALVKRELQFFLDRGVAQVKFVDRTFNCSRSRAAEIWLYLLEHDNGVTNFHFEISADLLDEEELAVMKRMRPGLIQLEIGVQSTNPHTLFEIKRKTDLGRLRQIVGQIHSFHNIHQHLDLIAGLPYEDYDSFCRSFDEVYRMEPAQLQLGFLKVLKGSDMALAAKPYGLLYRASPPYEVLSTRWLDFRDVMRLKGVEEMVEVYSNSGQFTRTLRELNRDFSSPFKLFEELAKFYDQNGLSERNVNRMDRYEILEEFVKEKIPNKLDGYRDRMVYDLFLRENLKSRPRFATDQEPYKEWTWEFFKKEAAHPAWLACGYEGFTARQLIRMAHVEVFRDGTAVLFDYKKRDALSCNAAAFVIARELQKL